MTDTPKDVEAVARAIEHAPLRLAGTSGTTDVYLTLFDYIEDGLEDEDFEGFGVSNVYEIYLAIVQAIARSAIKAHTECLMEPSEETVNAGRLNINERALEPNMFADRKLVNHIGMKNAFQAMLSAKEKT